MEDGHIDKALALAGEHRPLAFSRDFDVDAVETAIGGGDGDMLTAAGAAGGASTQIARAKRVESVLLKDILMEFDDEEMLQLRDSSNMFRDCRVFVYTPPGAGLQRRLDDDDVRFNLELHGGLVIETMDGLTTHVVVRDDEVEFAEVRKQRDFMHQSALETDSSWVEKRLVLPLWVQTCVRQKERACSFDEHGDCMCSACTVDKCSSFQVTSDSARRATRQREADEAAAAAAAEAEADMEAPVASPASRGQKRSAAPDTFRGSTQRGTQCVDDEEDDYSAASRRTATQQSQSLRPSPNRSGEEERRAQKRRKADAAAVATAAAADANKQEDDVWAEDEDEDEDEEPAALRWGDSSDEDTQNLSAAPTQGTSRFVSQAASQVPAASRPNQLRRT